MSNFWTASLLSIIIIVWKVIVTEYPFSKPSVTMKYWVCLIASAYTIIWHSGITLQLAVSVFFKWLTFSLQKSHKEWYAVLIMIALVHLDWIFAFCKSFQLIDIFIAQAIYCSFTEFNYHFFYQIIFITKYNFLMIHMCLLHDNWLPSE